MWSRIPRSSSPPKQKILDETLVWTWKPLQRQMKLGVQCRRVISLSVVDPGFTKGGGHKIVDLLSITKTSKWEVVKNSASPKRPFFFWTSCHFSHFKSISRVQIFSSIFWPQISLFHLFLNSTPTSNPKRGGTLSMPIHFPIGTRPHLAKKGGACA